MTTKKLLTVAVAGLVLVLLTRYACAAVVVDPYDHPAEAIYSLADAWKLGWVAFVSLALQMACMLFEHAKSRLAWLGASWHPLAVGLVASAAAGVYDVAIVGGSGVALLAAASSNVLLAIKRLVPVPKVTAPSEADTDRIRKVPVA